MSRIIIIENTSANHVSFAGVVLDPNTTRDITGHSVLAASLSEDDEAFGLVADGTIVVHNDTGPFSPAEGWKYLVGNIVTSQIAQTSYTTGNKLWVHDSPRPEKEDRTIFVYWTGAGEQNSTLGSDGLITLDVTTSNPTVTKDIYFYKGPTGEEKTYLFKAHICWAGASLGDAVSAEAVALPAQMQTIQDLDYTLDGSRVRYAGPGLGTHGFAATPSPVHNYDNTGHWFLSPVDSSLVPVMDGTGNADIYWDQEKTYAIFMNQIPIMGSSNGYLAFDNWDSIQLRDGYYIKFTAHNNSDTNWQLCAFVTMFRERAA